jgi:Zn-dependent peptidase ImmA (M78 family)
MTTLDRGFKTWAERTALGLRRELGLQPHAPLDPRRLAEYLDVRVWTPRDVPGNQKSVLDQLLRHDPWGWSAVSQFGDHYGVIIYNPRHSQGRQASDIMHELAHFILDHQQGTMIMSHDGSMVMRSYDRKQEDEANWLAWCLLLPREVLIRARRMGNSAAQIAEQYGVSETLAVFRLQMSGVEAQLRAAGRDRLRKRNA